MPKGIIYITTTSVTGLIKIGQTGTPNYAERMRGLSQNGYYNVNGLKPYFAIELEDYKDKERLLHEVFSKHRLGTSELFSDLDPELVRQLLLLFDGRVVFPDITDKEKVFEEVVKARTQSAKFSFYAKGLKDGDVISFVTDPSIQAIVAGEREVKYGGQVWKLSPLTYKIFESKNELTNSGTYQGARHWQFNGKRLTNLPNLI